MVDKNLFPHNLAIVAIMKNEEPYVKEWIDYHLLAGVDHFYIYDNDSTPKFKEILQPYINAGIVTYKLASGRHPQLESYNDTIKRYRFFCRYIAAVDTDEFIFPKSGKSILATLDEIFSLNKNAGGLLINWHCFGSNGHREADYSKGVLDRFTRRAENGWYLKPEESPTKFWAGNIHVKSIVDPRKVDFFSSPHFPVLLNGVALIGEDGKPTAPIYFRLPITDKKIIFNHYWSKSYEEHLKRRGHDKLFNLYDRNEVFDDGIVKYRDSCRKALLPQGGGY